MALEEKRMSKPSLQWAVLSSGVHVVKTRALMVTVSYKKPLELVLATMTSR